MEHESPETVSDTAVGCALIVVLAFTLLGAFALALRWFG